MKYESKVAVASVLRALFAIVLVASIAACSSTGDKPKPAALAPNTAQIAVSQAWTARIGPQTVGLQATASGNVLTVAGRDGSVAAIDAATGRDVWRTSIRGPIAAGVGSDGRVAAVVSDANEVVALDEGREIWREKLSAQVFTPPFVAGGRVFVLAADRSVMAFDGQTGRLLWRQQRPGEPLVLRQPGVVLAVGDTLVVGLSGRLAGLNPLNGAVRWEAPIASPRGINDVERLVDLVGRASRRGDVVCARAFQSSVGCVNAERGSLLWAKPANGFEGLDGDNTVVFGTEGDGKVVAWRTTDGERVWTSDKLLYRGLSAPALLGRSVAIGDSSGFVHLLSREDGALLNRLSTDGSAIVSAPVLVGGTLVAITRNGGLFGFKPE
ncbi:MAG TPA: outer membrane protein assembly factor BamB [Burkholderiaceae bacterium]